MVKRGRMFLVLLLTLMAITMMTALSTFAGEDTTDEMDIALPVDEETVGSGDITIDDGLTATFDEETGALEFYSNGGTLPLDWVKRSGLDKDSIESIKVAEGTVYLPKNSSEIFAISDVSVVAHTCSSNLKKLDLSGFDTSNVETMKNMFIGCSALTELDLSGFDTSNVKNMAFLLYGCSGLTSVNLKGLDTSNVDDMSYMFRDCSSLTNLDVSGFVTSNVRSMFSMFENCSSLVSLDVTKFNTSKVEGMTSMFQGCSSLTSIDVSNFDTSNVSSMLLMFDGCSSLTSIDVSNFKTSKVGLMGAMFQNCTSLTSLDLSNFDATNLWVTEDMFKGCSSLTSLDVSGLILTGAVYVDDMFTDCSALQELKTPKKNETDVELPILMYDSAGNEYETLPALSKSIVLTREKPVLRIDISDCEVTLSADSYTYDGKAKEPAVTVKRESETLTLGTDYTVTYLDNTNAGTATVKVEGIGGFKGEKTVAFTISKSAGFSDVQNPGHAYYKAIYWAAEEGITKGYPDGTFGIDKPCTRGEMMMFLWRYAGKPNPKNVSKSPFKDLKTNHTFYKAILWGSQKGITKGYPDGTFGINKNVSRGECMMFLWRLKGKPAPKAVAKSPFTDVPKNHVFYNAILWGAQKKITTGYTSGEYKGKFMVDQNCTRGQIVTFLYRAK